MDKSRQRHFDGPRLERQHRTEIRGAEFVGICRTGFSLSALNSKETQAAVRELRIKKPRYRLCISMFIGMDCEADGIPAKYAYIHICHLRSSSRGFVPSVFDTSAKSNAGIFAK